MVYSTPTWGKLSISSYSLKKELDLFIWALARSYCARSSSLASWSISSRFFYYNSFYCSSVLLKWLSCFSIYFLILSSSIVVPSPRVSRSTQCMFAAVASEFSMLTKSSISFRSPKISFFLTYLLALIFYFRFSYIWTYFSPASTMSC